MYSISRRTIVGTLIGSTLATILGLKTSAAESKYPNLEMAASHLDGWKNHNKKFIDRIADHIKIIGENAIKDSEAKLAEFLPYNKEDADIRQVASMLIHDDFNNQRWIDINGVRISTTEAALIMVAGKRI